MIKIDFSSKIFKNILLMSTGGFLVSLFFLLSQLGQIKNSIGYILETFLNPVLSSPQIEDYSLIINQIREVSELTTSVFVMEAVVPTSQERKLGNFVIGKTQLLYIARGQVRAGVDLETLKPEQIKIDNNILYIQLPPAKILDSKIDVNYSRVYDYDRGFLGLGPDVAPQLQTLAQQETLKKIVATACQQGILEEANAKAKLVITQLLTSGGYKKVEIKTDKVSAETNCQK